MRIKGKHSRLKKDIGLPSIFNEALDGKSVHELSSKDQLNSDSRVRPNEVHGYSKRSRFPIEKISSDYSPLTQPSCLVNGGSSDLTGGIHEDYKELLAAVEDVNNARSQACSKPFWIEMEPYFRIVTQDDLDYLKQQVTRSSPETDGKWLEKMTPLTQRLLSALIVVEDDEQVMGIVNDNGHENFDCVTEVSPCISHFEKYSEDANMAGQLQMHNNERLNISHDSTSLDGYIKFSSEVYVQSDKSGLEYDFLEGLTSDIDISKADSGNVKKSHVIGLQWSQSGSQSGHQAGYVASRIATHEIEYQQMSLDEKILLELHSIGLFLESVPDLESEDDDRIEEELNKLIKEFQEKIRKTEAQIIHLEKAVSESWKLEERECERLALSKLVLRASKRYLGPRGRGFQRRSAAKKVEQQANLDFVKRTLHRCKKFDETGRSCFNESSLKEKFCTGASKEATAKSLEYAIEGKIFHVIQNNGDNGGPSDMKLSDFLVAASQNSIRHAVQTHKKDKVGNLQADPHQSCSLEQTSGKPFLENGVGSMALTEAPVFTTSLLKGVKEKICKRESKGKGQNKEMATSMNDIKDGLQGNIKGIRKSTTGPNWRTTQLLKSNGLLGKTTGELSKSSTTLMNLEEKPSNKFVKEKNGFTMGSVLALVKELECEPLVIDLSNVELPVMNYVDKLDVP